MVRDNKVKINVKDRLEDNVLDLSLSGKNIIIKNLKYGVLQCFVFVYSEIEHIPVKEIVS